MKTQLQEIKEYIESRVDIEMYEARKNNSIKYDQIIDKITNIGE